MSQRARVDLIAVFPTRKLLVRALDELRAQPNIAIEKAAILARADDGEVRIVHDSLGPDEAGITGGTLGAAIALLGLVQFGALALPGIGIVIALGAGALVGGLVGNATGRFAANLIGDGYGSDQIEALQAEMEADRPALLLTVADDEGTAADQVTATLKRNRGRLIEQADPNAAGGA